MNTHVIFLHGFNIRDAGAETVAKLIPFFANAGCSTEILAYGHFNLFMPRWKNQDVAKTLHRLVTSLKLRDYRVIVVGHSNGCTITHIAGEQLQTPIDKAVYIGAALDRGVKFPNSFGAFDVWHNPKDWVVKLSRLLPFHRWGDMGATGFTRFDYRGHNYNMLTNYEVSSGKHHSAFSDEKLAVFGPSIVEKALL